MCQAHSTQGEMKHTKPRDSSGPPACRTACLSRSYDSLADSSKTALMQIGRDVQGGGADVNRSTILALPGRFNPWRRSNPAPEWPHRISTIFVFPLRHQNNAHLVGGASPYTGVQDNIPRPRRERNPVAQLIGTNLPPKFMYFWTLRNFDDPDAPTPRTVQDTSVEV